LQADIQRYCLVVAKSATCSPALPKSLPRVQRVSVSVVHNMATCGLSFTRVHNTFIETVCELSPSLEPFLNERVLQTCPAGRVGELQSSFWLDEVADAKDATSPRSTQTGGDDSVNELRSDEESFQEYVDQEVMATPTEWDLPCLEFLPSGPVTPEPYLIPFAYDNGMVTNLQVFAQYPRRIVSLASALDDMSDDLQMRRVSSEPQPACRHDLVNQARSLVPRPRAMSWQPNDMPLPVGEVRDLSADPWGKVAPPARSQDEVAIDDGMPVSSSAALPSFGSADHASGTCSPCAFFQAGRCTSGSQCRFCHLCDAGARKRLKKEKLEMRRANRAARRHNCV